MNWGYLFQALFVGLVMANFILITRIIYLRDQLIEHKSHIDDLISEDSKKPRRLNTYLVDLENGSVAKIPANNAYVQDGYIWFVIIDDNEDETDVAIIPTTSVGKIMTDLAYNKEPHQKTNDNSTAIR